MKILRAGQAFYQQISGQTVFTINALPELVTPGVTGDLFTPQAVADTARCRITLLQNQAQWSSFGVA